MKSEYLIYTYLFINILVIIVPLIRSFESKIAFYKKWKFFVPANILVGILFISWDVYFTRKGVWGFNPDYILNVRILDLPLGEWLFFIFVPYACVFGYEVINYFIRKNIFAKIARPATLIISITFLIVAYFFQYLTYTFWVFSISGITLLAIGLIPWKNLGRFYYMFIASVIPFIIMNGILTGLPIVEYDKSQHLGIYIFSIPIEDLIYSLLLLILTTFIYDKLKLWYEKHHPKRNQ